MIDFESQYFQKLDFKKEQIKQFSRSALHDLKIAERFDIPDVIFKFSYDALIKLGIALIARKGHKTRSKTGHRVKIIEKLSQILKDEDIVVLGNKMRQERNFNLNELHVNRNPKLCTDNDALGFWNGETKFKLALNRLKFWS